MRSTDLASLRRPFSPGEDPELAFPKAIGIDLPEVEHLYRQIFDDLDDRAFGIGWWAPHPGTSRRILISHYLLECVRSIRQNLSEAGLHLLEAVSHWDEESYFVADCVSVGADGQASIKIPSRKSSEEDLARRMAILHIVGFFRATVGALDCLGASIIGVLAIPKNIQYADLKIARDGLNKASHQIQSDFSLKLKGTISSAGPVDWLEWATDFRNMVTHRGRRMTIGQCVPRRPFLLDPDGKIIPRAVFAEHLPSDPCRSQIEAFLDIARTPVLTEHAEATMRGVLTSSIVVIRELCGELVEVWKTRRSTPSLLNQPKSNWPEPSRSTQFKGYRPGSLPFNPSEWASHPDIARQFRSASLADDLRQNWDTFD